MEDFRGSHDFQGERRGNQSSPTEVKRGRLKKSTANFKNVN